MHSEGLWKVDKCNTNTKSFLFSIKVFGFKENKKNKQKKLHSFSQNTENKLDNPIDDSLIYTENNGRNDWLKYNHLVEALHIRNHRDSKHKIYIYIF